MSKDDLKPNHVGLIEKAISQFDHVYHFFKIGAISKDFVGMVNLLDCVGSLDEVEWYTNDMTWSLDSNESTERAKFITKCLIEIATKWWKGLCSIFS